jgi:putative DNA primase/helicase
VDNNLNLDLQTLARALDGEVRNGQVAAPGPNHSKTDRSLSVRPDPAAPDGFVVHSFADDDPIQCRDYVRQKVGLSPWKPGGNGHVPHKSEAEIEKSVMAAIMRQGAETESKSHVVARYDYRDEQGTLLYQVERLEPKRFRQRRPDGNGGWIWKLDDVRRVVYRWPELLKFPDATVFVCEGEKDADRVASLGHCATTVACGKWTDECVKALAGHDCVVLADNDETGHKKAYEAATALHRTAKTIRVVCLPDLPEKGDVRDWLDADARNAEKFVETCLAAPLWTPDSSTPVAASSNTGLQFAHLNEVEARHVEWLWPNRLARGKLTLLAGDPGIGKSQISCDAGARTSTGAVWPDGGRAPLGSVVVLSAEDSANDTLRPRFEAAGANLERIHVLTATLIDGKPVTFSLQAHLEMLGNKLAELGDVALVIIDPITSYMGKIDGHQAVDVRTVLEPLAAFAEKHDIAVLAISHPPKASQSKALHAVTGSLAFVAAARLVFIATKEPQTERRLFLPVKNNLGPLAAGLGFNLEQCFIGNEILTSRVRWDNAPVATTADEAVAASNNEGPTAMREAADFLREELANEPRSVRDLKQAAADAGLSWATIRRAQKDLGIKPKKDGLNGGWLWQLPMAAEGAQGAHEDAHS